jgi:hypothetical protein
MADDERRIRSAQMAVWFACFAPAIAFGFVFMEIALGHPQQRPSIAVTPIQAALGCAWLALYATAGYLIGERRAAGGLLGLALFGGTVLISGIHDRTLTLGVAYSIFGILLILRARRPLRLPLLSLNGRGDG